jgi:hypothetical protein
VSPAVLQRQAALAGAALLAGLLVVVLDRPAQGASVAAPPPVSAARWETAVVGVFGRGRSGETTACGVTLAPDTRGVAHPVLPCGVDLVLAFGGREVRTEVIERGPPGTQTQFDVSPALAAELGLEGKKAIRWRFAG